LSGSRNGRNLDQHLSLQSLRDRIRDGRRSSFAGLMGAWSVVERTDF
jgi:hypothetical protein